jgi:hypothetical protein
MGAVRSVTGALTTALSHWSATIGGTTALIGKSESTLVTTSEETRRITGWRRARETGSVLLAELSTVSSMAGSLDGLMSPESAASKKYLLFGKVWKIVPVLQVTRT